MRSHIAQFGWRVTINASAAPGAQDVVRSLGAITNSAPMVQFDVVEGEAGEPRAAVTAGSTVVSNYFFVKEGGTWDAAWFGQSYAPKALEAFGPAAIRRIEVARGEVAQGGGAPLVTGAIHLYLQDPTAYDAAVQSDAAQALNIEAARRGTLSAVPILSTVHVVA